MGFEERILELSKKIPALVDHLQTEEATKNALVLPFIAALGYDVFNPEEVVPEFTADVGIKKGEKVDYAIMRDGETIALVECKKAGTDLCDANTNQLYRYFSVVKARIGIVTNGIVYRFFSDLDESNKMDARPFLELNLENLTPMAISEVKKMAKKEFDLDRMLSSASDLKYTSEIKKILSAQIEFPEDDFVKFFFKRAIPGALFTATAKAQFSNLVVKAFNQFLSEKVSNRLKSALESETNSSEKIPEDQPEANDETEVKNDGIVTTEEELEGYHIVRAIASQNVDPTRIVYRDTKSYMGILFDDNNRKPVCRLHFNSKQKYIGVFDSEKNETRIPIECPANIYKHSEKILNTVSNYLET